MFLGWKVDDPSWQARVRWLRNEHFAYLNLSKRQASA